MKKGEIELTINQLSTRVKLGTQHEQSRIQDNVDFTSLNEKSFDVDNYTYCKYRFVTPVGLDINEITQFNDKLTRSHIEKMKYLSNIPS